MPSSTASIILLAGTALANSQLKFTSAGNSVAISYDGTDLTVPGYARSSELTLLATDVTGMKADITDLQTGLNGLQLQLNNQKNKQATDHSAQGDDITNIALTPGEKGSTGAAGQAGAAGSKGEIGGVGAAGKNGSKGEIGAKGAAGQDGASVTGAKGDKGEDGSDGDDGATGATGGIVTPIGADFLASMCDEITVTGAGATTGQVNGIYSRSTAGLPNGGSAGMGYFCLENPDPAHGANCNDGVFNFYSGYGWGIQTSHHHSYMDGAGSATDTITPLDQIRSGYGLAPTPDIQCTKYRGAIPAAPTSTVVNAAFLASKCREITVTGSSPSHQPPHGQTSGVYRLSTAGLPNGGNAARPYFCLASGCSDGVFNFYSGYGWGIQTSHHHTYMDGAGDSDIVTALTQIRSGYGLAPTPDIQCTKYLA
jgi:hypothetical protein